MNNSFLTIFLKKTVPNKIKMKNKKSKTPLKPKSLVKYV
jgi:hypothetical protein